MVTSSELPSQGPLLMVHRKVLVPTESPLTVVVGLASSAKEPAPAITVHWPVPGKVTALAARAVLVAGVHSSWSGPASAAGWSPSKMKTLIWSLLVPHAPLSMVHSKTCSPTPRPNTAVLGSLGSASVPVPLMETQVPTAGNTGSLAISTALFVGVHQLMSLPA